MSLGMGRVNGRTGQKNWALFSYSKVSSSSLLTLMLYHPVPPPVAARKATRAHSSKIVSYVPFQS